MNLLIDDAKEGLQFDLVARNADAGLMILSNLLSAITELYIDFDLGQNSRINGNEVIKIALEWNCLPDKVTIVSLNPPGREQIKATLLDNGFKQIDGSRFERIE